MVSDLWTMPEKLSNDALIYKLDPRYSVYLDGREEDLMNSPITMLQTMVESLQNKGLFSLSLSMQNNLIDKFCVFLNKEIGDFRLRKDRSNIMKIVTKHKNVS